MRENKIQLTEFENPGIDSVFPTLLLVNAHGYNRIFSAEITNVSHFLYALRKKSFTINP